MTRPKELFTEIVQPGIRRDGTNLDSPFYSDGQWVRWQRGKPRKMGGYRAMSVEANGPLRRIFVDSRNGINTAHLFSRWGIERLEFSSTGTGSGLNDRTPAGFVPNDYTWSASSMFSSFGSGFGALVCAATPDLLDIASDVAGPVYSGDINGVSPLDVISDASGPITTSGGICVLQPFLFVYGSNGLIRNSNANDFTAATGWTTGGSSLANNANVSGTKFVYGAPVRGGGQSPAGLFWSLNSLVRVTFVGGTQIWNYDTLTMPTSILSKNAIVEHDGVFMWPGTDRFLTYTGVVQELPNNMNMNWFYDGLNYPHRQKVWGTKVPRWGEIWWFYPRGAATECNAAIIYNYRENTWYDAELVRSAGDLVEIFPFPVWGGTEDSTETLAVPIGMTLALTAQTLAGATVLNVADTSFFQAGDTLYGAGIAAGAEIMTVTGPTSVSMTLPATATMPAGTSIQFSSIFGDFPQGTVVTDLTSGATGTAQKASPLIVNLTGVSGTFGLTNTIEGPESFPGSGVPVGRARVLGDAFVQTLESVYQHETGRNKIVEDQIFAISSSFTTCSFGFAVGGPFPDVPKSVDVQTRLTRYEPDFNQVGGLQLEVLGRPYANASSTTLATYTITQDEPFKNTRDQTRIMQLRITSNELNGFYEAGQLLLTLEAGDQRTTVAT